MMRACLTLLAITFALPVLATPPAAPASGGTAKKPGSGKTLLKLDIEPVSHVFIDGKPHGSAGKRTLELTPGHHIIRLVHARDEHEEMVSIKKGETTEYGWKFEGLTPPPKNPSPKKEEPAEGTAPDQDDEQAASPDKAEPESPGGEPHDPAPDVPKRTKGVKAPKKDPFEGIQAPK